MCCSYRIKERGFHYVPVLCRERLRDYRVVRLNSGRERRDLVVLYKVEDNRLVVLEVESYVDDILDWEKRANGGREHVNIFRAYWFLIHLVSMLKTECRENTSRSYRTVVF